MSYLSGPIVFSSAGFVASLLVQKTCSPTEFGIFAFVQVAIATGMALSNGLITVPAASRIAEGGDFAGVATVFMPVGLMVSLVGATLIAVPIFAAGASGTVLLLSSILALITWARYAYRAICLVGLHRRSARNSDLAYGITHICCSLAAYSLGQHQVATFLFAQVFAALISAVPVTVALGHGFSWNEQVKGTYIELFKRSGAGPLASSFCGQVSSSSHAYVTALFSSPASFAPIALATLVYRPLGVILTGVMQFESPRIARVIRDRGSLSAGLSARAIIKELFLILSVCWLANAVVAILVSIYLDALVTDPSYNFDEIRLSIFLMSFLVLLRSLREPHSATLNLSGSSIELAKINAVCAGITLATVTLFALTFRSSPALTIIGPLIGEALNLLAVVRLSRGKTRV
ncbi:hypothetical protein [Sphingomonas sp. Y38-1Y]|uniref:hypothetical protein n=1 Tax=Sphingomonas sp. Y38-1Y TaxID=3078265 RepID=UPI0028E66EEA|nr:hypothetical protein [Sphingomonas sp. Y38-1Y]